jgi:hypothetical protein
LPQQFETHVTFQCPACSSVVQAAVDVPEPDWGAAESSSDLNSEGETVVSCNVCRKDFDAYVTNSAGDCHVTLNDHPDTRVDADIAFFSPDEDDWSDEDLPDNPYSIWEASYRQTCAFLDSHGEEAGDALINRMVFAQHVVALEAYLADTLLKSVLHDPKVLGRLLEQDTELRKERFSLLDIQANPDLVRDRVAAYLRDLRYHNLPKVNVVYKIALGVEVLPEGEAAAPLILAMRLRHDCVHRNGFNKDGEKLTNFTKAYVAEIADAFRKVVHRIDLALSPF